MTTTPVHSITDEQIAEIEDDGCYTTAAEFKAIIARLRKAEKDAARYRFLKENSPDAHMWSDESIDAALAEVKP